MNCKRTAIVLLLMSVLFSAAFLLRAEEKAAAPCPKKVEVVLETAKATNFMEYLHVSGQAVPEAIAVKSPVGGVLSELKVSEGSLIDAGQELAVLNAGANEEIKKLEEAAAKAKKVLTARQNWKEKSEKAIQTAANAYQKALDELNAKKAQVNVSVKAPVAGMARLALAAGIELAADALLLEIVTPRQMLFRIALAAADQDAVAIGDKFTGAAEGLSGEFAAEAVAVGDGQMTLKMDNEGNQVQEGARFAFKRLKAEHADAITVPSAALQQDSLGDYVYVLEKKKAKKLYVTVGAASDGRTLVEKGLFAGTPVIVSGLDCLVDGKKVRVVNEEELAKSKAEAEAKKAAAEEAKQKAEAERKAREAAEEAQKPVEPEVKPEEPPQEAKPAAKESRVRVGLIFGRFSINDKNMRDFYGDWFKNVPGVELSVHTIKRIDVWASYKVYTNEQATSYFGDPVDFKLSPLSVGLRYRFPQWRFLEPFAGAGLNFYSYKETIGGESDLEDTKGSASGFHFQGGTYFHVGSVRFLLGEVFFKYNMVKKTLDEALPDGSNELDLGGLEFGIGLVVKF